MFVDNNLKQYLRDGQAKTCSSKSPSGAGVGLRERLEEACLYTFPDTNAGVFDREGYRGAVGYLT